MTTRRLRCCWRGFEKPCVMDGESEIWLPLRSMNRRVGALLILPWRTAELTAEHCVQVLRRFEAAILRDIGNRRIRVFQSVGRRRQFEAQDLVVHAAAAHRTEVRLQ